MSEAPMSRPKDAAVREAVGIFVDCEHLHAATDELQASGFGSQELGLLAGELTVKQKLGEYYNELNESADTSGGPRTAFVVDKTVGDTVHGLIGSLFLVGTTIASGGLVASAAVLGGGLAAAVAGAVAMIGVTGGALSAIIHESDAEYLREQVDEGHLLLFVRTESAAQEQKALEILSRHSALEAKMYEAPLAEHLKVR
jgi:hypothetical protein